MSRIVADTNVLISFALNPRGGAGRAVEGILRRHELFGTPETVEEFYSVLFSEKIGKFVSFEAREQVAAFLLPFVKLRRVDLAIAACRDPKDDKFLEAAAAAKAECIVTGDADLLACCTRFAASESTLRRISSAAKNRRRSLRVRLELIGLLRGVA